VTPTMPDVHTRDEDSFGWATELFPEPDNGYRQPESPGTKKLRHLTDNQPKIDEAEVSTKLMQRPLSSGSKDLQDYAYGAAPKRDLQIPRKPKTTLYGAPAKESLCRRQLDDSGSEVTIAAHGNGDTQTRFIVPVSRAISNC
jgi:hypothetical protein